MLTPGVDFGILSGRALLVSARTGEEVATAVFHYPRSVLDRTLPNSEQPLPPHRARQHPQDDLDVFKYIVSATLKAVNVNPSDVVDHYGEKNAPLPQIDASVTGHALKVKRRTLIQKTKV